MTEKRLDRYITRFQGNAPVIVTPPAEALVGVIVIPCYLEPDWKDTLISLMQCDPPNGSFEVLVVVNASASAAENIRTEQTHAYEEITAFTKQHSTSKLNMHVIDAMNLPPKNAGVGLARKIGMDEALHRLDQSGFLNDGFIVGLDADSICESNYLTALESHFQTHPKTPGCSLHFEHPLSGNLAPDIYETAGLYELHLRYYVQALRHAGFPHAFHTIGSSMGVRAPVYMAQGGMNRRKAGEDFYFLHKIIPLGHFTELTDTTVFPSPRPSDRVPFGTGRAVSKHLGQKNFPTYPWEAFMDLKSFFQLARAHDPFANKDETSLPKDQVSSRIGDFLDATDGWNSWTSCFRGTAGFEAYQRRFFQWFDGFQCMKCIHFLRDQFHGEMEVRTATHHLLKAMDPTNADIQERDDSQLLQTMRTLQKKPWIHPDTATK